MSDRCTQQTAWRTVKAITALRSFRTIYLELLWVITHIHKMRNLNFCQTSELAHPLKPVPERIIYPNRYEPRCMG